jgi:hypothetical protein
MSPRAATAQACHGTLEDLGYRTCNKKRTGHTGFKWLGGPECPRCKALNDKISRADVPRPVPLKTAEQHAARKGKCGHDLARDNPGPLCGPCVTKRREEHPNQDLLTERYCKRQHDLYEVGLVGGVKCKKCHAEDSKKSYDNKNANLVKGRGAKHQEGREVLPGLKPAMDKAGYKVERLAGKADIPASSLRTYVKCTATTPQDRVARLANVLGVSIEELKGE